MAAATVRVSRTAARPSPWRWRGRPADVVLLAGKGHEDYQEVAGVRRPFSDVAEARAALQRSAGQHMGMMTLQQAQAHALLPGATLVGDGATPCCARAHRHPHAAAGRPVRRAQGRALRRQRLPAPGARSGAAAALAQRGLQPQGPARACRCPTPWRAGRLAAPGARQLHACR
jgi:murE/murF fusion protein